VTSGASAPYNGGMKRASVAVLLVAIALAGCGSSGSKPKVTVNDTAQPTPSSSCDSGCTPANQPALDAAASYAEQVAGDAHCYAGSAVDDDANKVLVYLADAPQSILAQLRARHPGTYVIHNDAPRTLSAVVAIQKSIDWSAWKARGIEIVSTGPTETGYLRVGVTKDVPKAQAAFDAKYGRGIIRVFKGEMAIAL
jgi:hypothetical protein